MKGLWSFAWLGSLCRMGGESSALGGLRKGALSNRAGKDTLHRIKSSFKTPVIMVPLT